MQARQSSNLKMLLRCKNPLNFGGFQKSHKITMDPPNFWFLRHSVQKTKARNPTGGDGGNGCTSFHRSRYDRRDKADGGNGGRGGDVILECSPTVWDLSKRATSHKRGTWNFKK